MLITQTLIMNNKIFDVNIFDNNFSNSKLFDIFCAACLTAGKSNPKFIRKIKYVTIEVANINVPYASLPKFRIKNG